MILFKLAKIVFFVILLTTLSSAATEYKKIIIGTYANQSQADRDLAALIIELEKDKQIVDLQYKHDFYFIARKSGKYYIGLIEPFSDFKVLKTVLTSVQKHRKGAFSNKVDKKYLLRNAKISQLQLAESEEPQEKETKPVVKKPEIKYAEEPQSTPKVKEIIVHKKVEKILEKIEPKPVQKSEEPTSKEEVKPSVTPPPAAVETNNSELLNSLGYSYYQIAALVFLLLSLVLLLYIRYLRKRNSELKDHFNFQHNAEIKESYEEIDRKEMFLAKVSHELRTPMNAIIGLSHIVLQSDLNPLQHANVSKIKHSGEMLLDIVNDILDISKMDAGELKIEKVKFDLNDVLEHISNMVSLKVQNKGLELIYHIEKDVPSVLVGDPLRLGQIFINLLDNAIKFTKEGTVELSIRKLEEMSDSIVGLEFIVKDTGIGMTEGEISNIFQDFTQADESISRVYGGTGLGLSITKQLVEMMGGVVDIQSTPDVGTSFKITIHFTIHEVDNKRYYRLPSKALMNKNALIVDSNPKSIKSLTNMLTYFHYKVETINTLEEADKLLSQVAFDMLIIDEQKLSKYSSDLIQLIKGKYDIKIILIESIYYQNTNNIRHLEEIDSYIMKPFNQNSIFNVILEVYGEKKLQVEVKPKITKEELSVFQNIHILVAEDNIINQRVISGLLDGSGFKLTMANNGQEAIEKLSKNPNVDLILMDINMNVMDGYTATKTIREYNEYDEIPIFALTANSLQKDIDTAMECGMQGYLTKPLNIDSLYEKLFTLFTDQKKEKKEKRYYEQYEDEQEVETVVTQVVVEKRIYSFSELDADLGLANSNGSEELYSTLLKNFLEMYNDAASVLDAIVKDRRYKDGIHFVHDIKGLSSYLGAQKVATISERLEKDFKSEKLNEHSILINKFTRDLELLLSDIRKYLDGKKS